MASPLPKDVKKQAEEKCSKEYPYLTVQDPGTVWSADGKTLCTFWITTSTVFG